MGAIGDSLSNFMNGTPSIGSIGGAVNNFVNNTPDYGTIGNAVNDVVSSGKNTFDWKKYLPSLAQGYKGSAASSIPVTGFQYQNVEIPKATMLPTNTTNNLYNYLMQGV